MIELHAIVPAVNPWPDLEQVFKEELTRAAEEAKTQYEKTVRTWDEKPEFDILLDLDNGQALVGTDSEIYKYVDQGTKGPYPIPKASNLTAKTLRFQADYTAKTRVNVVSSRAGGPRGPFLHRKRVMHPGIKARNFSSLIAKIIQGRLTRRMNTAIRRAAREQARRAKSKVRTQ